jgi:hypothetical protein
MHLVTLGDITADDEKGLQVLQASLIYWLCVHNVDIQRDEVEVM